MYTCALMPAAAGWGTMIMIRRIQQDNQPDGRGCWLVAEEEALRLTRNGCVANLSVNCHESVIYAWWLATVLACKCLCLCSSSWWPLQTASHCAHFEDETDCWLVRPKGWLFWSGSWWNCCNSIFVGKILRMIRWQHQDNKCWVNSKLLFDIYETPSSKTWKGSVLQGTAMSLR